MQNTMGHGGIKILEMNLMFTELPSQRKRVTGVTNMIYNYFDVE